MNKVYIASALALSNARLFEKFYINAPDERREKIFRLRGEGAKRLSLASEVLLHYALSNEGVKDYQLIYGKNGKPYVKGSNVFFNLSHSGDMVMCAVSNTEIGCDIERIREVNLSVVNRYFTPSEAERIFSFDDAERINEFFRFWVLKESFIKAIGYGLGLPLNEFSVNVNDCKVNIVQSVNNNKYYFKEIDSINGYKCAVCSLTPEFKVYNLPLNWLEQLDVK